MAAFCAILLAVIFFAAAARGIILKNNGNGKSDDSYSASSVAVSSAANSNIAEDTAENKNENAETDNAAENAEADKVEKDNIPNNSAENTEENNLSRNIFQVYYSLLEDKISLSDWTIFADEKAKIIKVPGDFTSIQEAIDAARAGDTILAAAGEYGENIFMKDGVSLIGAGADETVLDGGGNGNVVSFKNVFEENTRLEGFSIKNAGTDLSGIMIENSSPLINRNTVLDNDYDIYIKGESSPVVQRNRLSLSRAGVQIFNLEKPENSLPVIIDNFIFQNKKGVNIYQADAKIEHNTISFNDFYGSYTGATFGIYIASGGADITNNIITDNGTCELCSGIYADENSAATGINYNDLWNNKNNFLCFGECEMLGNNFSENPEFVDAPNGDFNLSEDSVFLEAGSDGKKLGPRI